MSYQQQKPPASASPPGMYVAVQSPNQKRVKEDPPSSQHSMPIELAVHAQASSGSAPSLYPNLKPLFQESGGSSIKTATTNGSVFSGSRPSQHQHPHQYRPAGVAAKHSVSTEELVNRLPISEEDKAKIREVLVRKEISIQKESGVVNNAESAESSRQRDSPRRVESVDPSGMNEHENEESHSGTGSKQLERWLFEVNSAIVFNMGRWKLNVDEKSLATAKPQMQQPDSHAKTYSQENNNADEKSVATPTPQVQQPDSYAKTHSHEETPSDTKRPNPIITQNLLDDPLATNDDESPRKMYAFTPVRETPATPLKDQDFFLTKEGDFVSLENTDNEQNTSSEGRSDSGPEFSSFEKVPSAEHQNSATDYSRHDYSYTENYDPEPEKNLEKKPDKLLTKPSRNNSKQIMLSIEGKYKNLRDNLIENGTSTEEYFGDRGTFDSKSTFCETIDTIVSSEHGSKGARATMEYTDIRDHFSLGILSTRTSGIVSLPSWDSAASYDSDSSERLFPGKGCATAFAGTRGCGLPVFMCKFED